MSSGAQESETNIDEDIPFHYQDFNKLLECMDDSECLIPESVIEHFINRSGCIITDPNVLRMVSLSTHKFLHDIISSAQRYQDKGRPQTSAQLKVEGLVAALAAKGIIVNKIDYLYGE